jgi:hypothetical protein
VSKLDVSRLLSEVEKLDNDVTEAVARAKVGTANYTPPVLSEPLSEFLVQNNIQLSTSQERTELIRQLHLLKDKIPVVHMTFAVEADAESVQQLVAWLRSSVHPQAVVAVGLQPSLIAGVYLRTPNKVHDLSLRGILEGKHDALVAELGALRATR